jgi:predicted ester cyclase
MTNPSNEAVVLRFYEQMNNERKLELAPELFTADHKLHDPQIPAEEGPEAMAAAVTVYQKGIDAHWTINEIFSAGDRVVVRWTGSGTHIGEVAGVPPTGRPLGPIECNVIHRKAGGKIAETWRVWDTLGFLQQLGVVPKT